MPRVGLIGFPLAHSLSPLIQGIAFHRNGLAVEYELWETEPSRVEERVRGLRDSNCLGANVTIPHKEAVIPFLDRLEATAAGTGAVNTIVSREGTLEGHNTDVSGFKRALARAGFSATGKRALVLGAGGAARAVAAALRELGAAEIAFADILPERADALASAVRSGGRTLVRALPLSSEEFRESARSCQLLVNCTPTGMRHSESEGRLPLDRELVPVGALVFDLVYNPLLTPLIAAARERGAQAVGGLAMLVYQAAASFELWTGLAAPEDEMLAAAERALSD